MAAPDHPAVGTGLQQLDYRKQWLDALAGLAGGLRPAHSSAARRWPPGSQRDSARPLRFAIRGAVVQLQRRQRWRFVDCSHGCIHRAVGPDGIPAYRLSPADDDTCDRVRRGASCTASTRCTSRASRENDPTGRRRRSAASPTACIRPARGIDLPGTSVARLQVCAARRGVGVPVGAATKCVDVAPARRGAVARLWLDWYWHRKASRRSTDQEFLPRRRSMWDYALVPATRTPLPGAVIAATAVFGDRFRDVLRGGVRGWRGLGSDPRPHGRSR